MARRVEAEVVPHRRAPADHRVDDLVLARERKQVRVGREIVADVEQRVAALEELWRGVVEERAVECVALALHVAEVVVRRRRPQALLADPEVTSVRLVTNAERVVLRETQRAYVYFSLHGLTVDRIVVNRVLPDRVQDAFFAAWRRTMQAVLQEIDAYFAPVPVGRVPLHDDEVVGVERLTWLAGQLYADGEDPAAVTRRERAFRFEKDGHGAYMVRLAMPFAAKQDVGVFKKGDELVVEIGTLRRHIGLPTSMAGLVPTRASLEDGTLSVRLEATA